jgi:hypothetical protein
VEFLLLPGISLRKVNEGRSGLLGLNSLGFSRAVAGAAPFSFLTS